jgi:hypothetical protein
MTGEMGYLALGLDPPIYFEKVLNKPVIDQYTSVKNYLTAEWNKSENKEKLRDTYGCLDKLSGSIYQINRLAHHHQHVFLSNLANFNETRVETCALGLEEACCDFESLILIARSCLDRLTGFTKNVFGVGGKGLLFSGLRNVFQNNCPRSINRNYIISLLDEAKWLEEFMITHEEDVSLRDTIAHYSSFSEETQFCGNIVKIGSDEIIASDLESHNIPLFETTWRISKFIPFFILNLLVSFNNLDTLLPLSDYSPKWKNWTIKISEFLEYNQPLSPGNITIAKRMYPGGFEVGTYNPLPPIYPRKINYCFQRPKYTSAKIKEGWELVGKTQNGFDIIIR